MSNYGIRHDPKIITVVILSMLLPADIGKKMLKESNLDISDKTIQRIKNDIKNLGVEHIIAEVHKLYLLTTVDSLVDAIKLKNIMFGIVNDPNADRSEKIKASQVIVSILKGIPGLYDPEMAESIPTKDNEDSVQPEEHKADNEQNKPDIVQNEKESPDVSQDPGHGTSDKGGGGIF